MAKATQDLSAKDFRDPLLKVLAIHTKFDSGRTVKAEDLYDPIYKMMGVNHEDYGEDGGVPWVQKRIQWAFQDLRDEGLGVKHGRGTWGLTPDGVDKARSMMTGTQNSMVDPDEDALNALAELISAVPLTSNHDDGTYHPDVYLRSVGLSEHKCMGFFTDQSPVCVTCSARTLCRRHMITKLAALAVEMNEADLLSAKEAIKKQAQANVASAKQIDPLEDPEIDRYQYQPPSDAIVVEQTCSGTVVCDQCGGMIKDGDPSVWVRKVGPKKSQSMMLHRECCAR